jgi:hypothetical protein
MFLGTGKQGNAERKSVIRLVSRLLVLANTAVSPSAATETLEGGICGGGHGYEA